MKMIRAFLADESGATAIEYGLIAAGISLVIIAAVNGVGAGLRRSMPKSAGRQDRGEGATA